MSISTRLHRATYGRLYPKLGKFEPHFLSRDKFSFHLVEDAVRAQLVDETEALPPDPAVEAKRRINAAEFEAKIKSDPHCKVIEEVLSETRKTRNDPYWIPFGMLSGGGMWFSLTVKKRLGETL